MAQAIDADDAMSVTEQLHTLTAFTTALPADRQTQQALAAEMSFPRFSGDFRTRFDLANRERKSRGNQEVPGRAA